MFQPSFRLTCMQGISGVISFKLNVMGSTMDKSGGMACVAVVYGYVIAVCLWIIILTFLLCKRNLS